MYKQKFSLAVGQYDLYVLFIELSYFLLGNKGILSFIVPTRLLSNENFMSARKFLNEMFYINTYVNAEAPFETVSVEANIMICSKSHENKTIQSFHYYNKNNEIKLKTNIRRETINFMPFNIFPFVFDQDIMDTFHKIQLAPSTELKRDLRIIRGFECGYRDHSITHNVTPYKLIKSEQIEAYFIKGSSKLFCEPDFSNPSKFKTQDVFNTNPKLVTKYCSSTIKFAYDTSGYYNTNSVYNCIPTDSCKLKFLLGYLNSPLVTFWFNVAFMNIDDLFPHIQKNQLETIPVPTMKNIDIESIEKIVDKILVNNNDNILMLQDKINSIIYGYYNLTEKEIEIIESGKIV